MSLEILDLKAGRDGKEIVHGVTLVLAPGETQTIMGPNGSGKSTLAGALMGHPAHKVLGGHILLDGEDITAWTPDRRSRAGLFLSFQQPPEIPGVTVANFLRAALNVRREKPLSVMEFHALLKKEMTELKMEPTFASRSLNEGFSGGERKRLETLQLVLLAPKYAILDETDSGLDVDALRTVTEGIERARRNGTGLLVITHYTHILEILKPQRVHILVAGRIVKIGGPELAGETEKNGYDSYLPKS